MYFPCLQFIGEAGLVIFVPGEDNTITMDV